MARPVNFNPEKTVRLNFYGSYNSRNSGTKDQRWINCFLETVKDQDGGQEKFYCKKRPGATRLIQPTGATSSAPRGIYLWNGTIYSVWGNSIYANGTAIYTTMSTTVGTTNFQETRPGAVTQLLSINDGINLYVITPTNVVGVVTPGLGFPSPNTTDLVFHDGYLFVLKSDATLWSCNFDDPTTWNPANFITAQMSNGRGVGLAHQNNYVVVFTDRQIQFFYDNANAAGSPMNNADTAMQQIGCASQGSLQHNESQIFFVGNGTTGQPVVYSLDGTTGLAEISTPAENRMLAAEGTNIVGSYGCLMRIKGHFFYALTLPSTLRTLVYDIDQKTWVEWTDISYGTAWPYISVTQDSNTVIGQHNSDGFIYVLSDSIYQDNNVSFPVKAQLNKRDMETTKRKFMNRVELVGDLQTFPSPVSIYYTDDDYQTFSSPRVFDQSQRCFFRGAGAPRRRAWIIESLCATDTRWECLEMDVVQGDY